MRSMAGPAVSSNQKWFSDAVGTTVTTVVEVFYNQSQQAGIFLYSFVRVGEKQG